MTIGHSVLRSIPNTAGVCLVGHQPIHYIDPGPLFGACEWVSCCQKPTGNLCHVTDEIPQLKSKSSSSCATCTSKGNLIDLMWNQPG